MTADRKAMAKRLETAELFASYGFSIGFALSAAECRMLNAALAAAPDQEEIPPPDWKCKVAQSDALDDYVHQLTGNEGDEPSIDVLKRYIADTGRVPREATPEMILAGMQAFNNRLGTVMTRYGYIWQAMLAAAENKK